MERQRSATRPGAGPHAGPEAGPEAGPGAGPEVAAGGAGLLTRIERALSTGTAAYLPGDGWIRLTLPLDDGGPVPVTVDVVADAVRAPQGIAYLLPGGGLNFAADFFTPGGPDGHGLAHELRRQGMLVVGVTPREDAAAATDITAEWGLAAHRRDLARVVAALDSVLRLPYQYAGHSAGAVLALDAASHDDSPRLRRVVALDTTGPCTGGAVRRAAATRDAYAAQLARGAYAADPGLAALVARAVADPAGPSSVPWPPDPELRFTHAGLAHFALIRTAALPGAANWIYAQGHSAGEYSFGATPAEDVFALTHTSLATWHAATAALGSGLVPAALMRDLAAIWAGDEATYRIAWDRIRAEVVWVNTALGRGDHPRGAELIRAGGNDRVSFAVVPGYGHGDAVWSGTAAADVWSLF
uniref:Alpha/beta hydrolase n=1 Tax=Streptomyces sp. NBC_00049 TaxID=2903617 RepID=A0AAU2JQY7_9ACTN